MSHVTSEAFPADPGLPELQVASDPALMRGIFQRHLRPPVGNQVYEIRDCRVARIGYERSKLCVLQYELDLVTPGTGQVRTQWVTCVLYAKDRTERLWRELRASDAAGQIPEHLATYEPVSLIPELRMLVQVFPFDRGLPTLPGLMASRSPDVESLLLAQFGSGDWRVKAWGVEAVRYHPELRATLRFRVQAQDRGTPRTEERRFYVKVYPDQRAEEGHRLLQALHARAEARRGGFTVMKPVAHLSRFHALVLEEAPGTSLQQILLECDDIEAAVRQAARGLAAFHLDEIPMTRHYSVRKHISRLERAAELLGCASPALRAEARAIVGALASRLEEVPPGPTHRNLQADHIFLDGDRLVFIDLDSFAGADPVLDPAHFLVRLGAMPGVSPVPQSRAQRASQVFCEEYFALVPKDWRSRLPLQYAGAALRLAGTYFRSQKPGWSDRAAAMVKEASDSLAGRRW